VYIERAGMLEPTPVRFKDEAHLIRIVNKIVSAVGRRVDETQPLCDARLLDGSRINIAVRPIAVDGPLVSIRKFSKKPYNLKKLIEVGALKPAMGEVLAAAVSARITTIISGGTGSGKTTMLNALSAFISDKERLVTIEDAAELQLQQPHVGRMETRPPNVEGKGEIRQRELVKNALRMRPDRIILGECRGEEAFDMLQAMNTGHEGSMATVHANTPRDAISRLEQMIGMAGMPMTIASIRGQIAAAIRIIVQLSRLSDGKRRVMSIAEITGLEGDIIQMQEIYKYTRTATLEDGTVQIRRERGLTTGGDFRLPVISLNKLILQSGLSIGLSRIVVFAGIGTVVVFAVLVAVRGSIFEALLAAVVSGLMLPYATLRMIR